MLKYFDSIHELLGYTDIYLIDQIMKDRYKLTDTILDAGCGDGRNMHWFLQNNIAIFGIDKNHLAISQLQEKYNNHPEETFVVSDLEFIPFPDSCFNHIICSAVLHFANSTSQFHHIIKEIVRILKPGGSLFIRMTSDIGIEANIKLIGEGIFFIPDGTKRFLLTRPLLEELMQLNNLHLIEPLKTVNVNDERCMSTLLLQKNEV